MADIVMPRLSDTMEEGTILRWLVADGEQVSRGQELVEIETDKANMTYESDQEGVLQRMPAEDPSARERVKASPLAKRIASERGVDLHTVTGSGPGGRIVKADVQEATAEPPSAAGLAGVRSEEHTSELQSLRHLVCRL